MSKQREALHIALEALEQYGTSSLNNEDAYSAAINAIREALAEREQEPVAWLSIDSIGEHYLYFSKPLANDPAFPLYLAPTALTEPLTDEELKELWKEHGYKSAMCMKFARAIEKKIRGEYE